MKKVIVLLLATALSMLTACVGQKVSPSATQLDEYALALAKVQSSTSFHLFV